MEWGTALESEILYLIPAAAAACVFGGLYVYKMRKYKRSLKQLSSEIDRILHGEEELSLGSYEEGEIAILRDEIYKLTVRLREQSEKLTKDKGILADSLADISHQIRTPLTTLNLMTARMMQEGENPQQRKKILREMNRMQERIDWLITALLKLSKLDAGAVQMERRMIDLSDFLRRALEPFEIQMELRGQTCSIEGAKGLTIYADETWTLEAVQNILKNSLEYAPRRNASDYLLYEPAVHGDCHLRRRSRDFHRRPAASFRALLPRQKCLRCQLRNRAVSGTDDYEPAERDYLCGEPERGRELLSGEVL